METPRPDDRIVALDVLRGIAVGGILFANVLVFFGVIFNDPAVLAAMPTAATDRVVALLERVFVEGKFYSVFSLLFGIGFGVQLARGGQAALPRFNRRLRILLAIGAVHALFIWAGDILMLYALLGLTMPWFARKPDSQLLRWTVGLLALPSVLYLAALAVWMAVAPAPAAAPAAAEGAGLPAEVLAIFERMGRGGLKDALIGNLVFLIGRWMDLFATVRFPKVLGMFVLGLWAVRSGIALTPQNHRETLRTWALLGWGIGLPANILAAWAFSSWPYLPPSAGGFIFVAGQAVGIPMLAIGYACTVALIVTAGWRAIDVFAPVGRMALTNYLMHSVICVVLSYGFGFGLWWRIGQSYASAIAVAIIAAQIPLSALWLSRYRFGPAEWVWRRLTYGRPI